MVVKEVAVMAGWRGRHAARGDAAWDRTAARSQAGGRAGRRLHSHAAGTAPGNADHPQMHLGGAVWRGVVPDHLLKQAVALDMLASGHHQPLGVLLGIGMAAVAFGPGP